MAASRIFIKGLPPTFSDADFKKHFSQNGRFITDAKIFPNRRIGYVGYKSSEEAQKAVRYFNKTFIRMSRIGVELARPIEDAYGSKSTNTLPFEKLETSTHSNNAVLKRKRESDVEPEHDSKLKEYLDVMKPKNKKKAWEAETTEEHESRDITKDEVVASAAELDSDGEYEHMSKAAKPKLQVYEKPLQEDKDHIMAEQNTENVPERKEVSEVIEVQTDGANMTVSDADWARSRTSRLLGLLDDEEEASEVQRVASAQDVEEDVEEAEADEVKATSPKPTSIPTPPHEQQQQQQQSIAGSADSESAAVRASMRLFIRNLPYDVSADDIEAEFSSFGNLTEVHVPLDKKTGSGKGFAYVQYSDSDSAEQAFVGKDGQAFQGRLLHLLPAAAKRENKLDEFALSKLPVKKQQEIKRRREASSSAFNWNALYMNADAVVSSVADRLGLAKSEVLDPTSSDAAVKQALAETHVIQETKAYFRQHGVDLGAFKKSQRGDTAILVKNIPYDCSKDELKRLFEEQGDVKRFLMPPSGIIAIVEFTNVAQCKTAFGALAYRKLKSSVLFLEKAPKDVFIAVPVATSDEQGAEGVSKVSSTDLKDIDEAGAQTGASSTLFVRNLNFSTTNEILANEFKSMDGLLSARVKTKTDPKKPGQVLSMGFGFLEFRTDQQAQLALRTMDGHTLEGHKLQIRASHKGASAVEERKKADAQKRAASHGTKIIIKNLPFEASKKDVRALFSAYGELRSVRVPKKLDHGARGFAFADFRTIKEAQNAMEMLRDTHLLGRRLVLDFAAEDAEDAEEEIAKMQQKVGAQVNKVALQKLTSGGRKKFTTQNDDEEG